MSSCELAVSVSGQESSSGESVGFEELVEWKGPIYLVEGLKPSILYSMDEEDFYFPQINEDDVSSGMEY